MIGHRVRCAACGRSYLPKKDGTVRAHAQVGLVLAAGYCEGSGRHPRQEPAK